MRVTKNQIKLIRSLQQKKFRDREGLFVAEGDKCISDLRSAFELVLLVTPDDATPEEIRQMSSLRTPQGAIALFRIPDTPADFSPLGLIRREPFLLALDGVQDPGNLGTIIRTADWFGIRHILCSRDTADCYNPKVVQATMGSLARVRLRYIDLPEALIGLRQNGLPVYGTLLDGTDIYRPDAWQPRDRGGVIVMGNEGNGLSPQVRSLVTNPLRIPSFPEGVPTAESLNVAIATAVVLAELRHPAPSPEKCPS